MRQGITFEIISRDKTSNARVGKLTTAHGEIQTPELTVIGTQATVKTLSSSDLIEIGVQIVMGNTYHLHLQPGEELIAKMGGLGNFMGWNKPMMTDSGGFQVFSLGIGLEHGIGKLLKQDSESEPKPRRNYITEEGVEFRSHIDGSKHTLTPESSIAIQEKLGSDLIVGFDDLESPRYSFEDTKNSLELTNRWLLRSMKAHKRRDQLLYGVTHGGSFKDLRIASAHFNDTYFDAIALGGAHQTKQNMYQVVDWTIANVSFDKPKHMLGVGEVDDIFEIVERGVDTFDCTIPTRLGRSGFIFEYPPIGNLSNRFRVNITKSVFSKNTEPLSVGCICLVCQRFSKAYVNHLFRSRELLAYRLTSYHNVYFLVHLMKLIRQEIQNGRYSKLKKDWLIS